MSKGKEHAHHITLEIFEGATGAYVAQVKEIPGIIVQAETKDKLGNEVKKSLDLYFKAFPAEHDKVFHTKQNVEYQKMEVTVTI